jgi:hypothetical protein
MTPEHDDPVKRLWHQQEKGEALSAEAVRRQASKFTRGVRARNLVEYAAAAAVVAISVRIALATSNPLIRIGEILIGAAALFVVSYMHRKGWIPGSPDAETPATSVAFYRAQLIRQRDLMRGVWLWYGLPFAPGIAFVLAGRVRQDAAALPFALATAIGAVIVAAALAYLNARAARRLQADIDRLS